METFFDKNGTRGMEPMERQERNGKTVLLLRTERNGTIQKKERERNDLAEGPRSRTERFQRSRNVPSPNVY